MWYKTRNLTLAAYLRHEGMRLDSTERTGSQVTFIFQDPALLAERYEDAFNDGDVTVNLKKFMTELNGLRDMIFKEGK